ncbi:MAG: endonuclease/exonuclease/phosphatase family protein [Gemmataceae bacterium]
MNQAELARTRRRRRRLIVGVILTAIGMVGLFVVNGLVLGHGETPYLRSTNHAVAETDKPTVKILAYNIAKCFVHPGGVRFEKKSVVAGRVEQLAAVIRAEQPDLVFLSEAILECTPCPVNQVQSLAEQTGMHSWCFGENFNVGLPFFRMISGNAILSRGPLEPVANPSLAGRRPFYAPKNNRRVLWCQTNIAGRPILLASIHNDSFNLDNNRKQLEQILAYAGPREAILAGDFNAEPDDDSIQLVKQSGQFSGVFAGHKTFPSDRPARQIDFIFAPASWELVEYRVLESEVSDHRPVVSVFRPR